MSYCETCEASADKGITPEEHGCCADGNPLRALVGRRVLGVFFLATADDALVFRTEAGWYRANTESDCCSETWIADVLGVQQLLGAVVLGVRTLDVDGPESDERSRQDVDVHYGIALATTQGECRIIYRNSSNGYYGGSMCDLVALAHPEELSLREIRDDYPEHKPVSAREAA